MLEIGNGGMNNDEYKTHMSLWCILAAPLLAGNDLRSMGGEIRDILTNRDVIAIDQDKLGKQGSRIWKEGDIEMWAKPLTGGEWAVGLFNRGETSTLVAANWADLHLKSGRHEVRNLWSHSGSEKVRDQFSVQVQGHGVVLIRVK
jgi:alpha-galactosidase